MIIQCTKSMRAVFSIWALCLWNSLGAEFVPVLMWELSSAPQSTKEVSALSTINTDVFKDIVVQRLQHKSGVVVFAEENLSVEDFIWQDEAGEGAFPNLESLINSSDTVEYFPFVHSPLHAFHHLPLQGQSFRHIRLGAEESLSDLSESDNMLFVSLDDANANEDRPLLLRRHDSIMAKLFGLMARNHSNVLAIYTAHHSSWQLEGTGKRRVRHLLETDELKEDEEDEHQSISKIPPFFNNSTILYSSNITLLVKGENTSIMGIELGGGVVKESDESRLILQFLDRKSSDITLDFQFDKSTTGYWSLYAIDITYENELATIPVKEIQAPLKFSYHCGKVHFENATAQRGLIMHKFQVQPFSEELKFGDAYDCIYFVTVPIWSGLFVCFLFSVIMTFGLVMIMDIRTMDRFDDPKGKTITINVSE